MISQLQLVPAEVYKERESVLRQVLGPGQGLVTGSGQNLLFVEPQVPVTTRWHKTHGSEEKTSIGARPRGS